MPEREGNLSLRKTYLSDCNDISTPNPLITAADEHEFRTMFGIPDGQKSILFERPQGILRQAGKKIFRITEKEYGLIIGTPIPGQCLRFSLVFEDIEMHAVIKTAPGTDRLHLDAAQVMRGGSAYDLPCGDAGVEKAFLEIVISHFQETAQIMCQQTDMTDVQKSILEQQLIKKFEHIDHDVIMSAIAEAQKTAIPAEHHRHLRR